MQELHAILKAWRALDGPNRDAVLATVVHVKGSAYRRPGARMLIVPDGRRIGSVSGGCLEGEITRTAWWFTESGAPVVRVYDTTSDDDAVWEFGLGCNGVVQVMLERVQAPAAGEMLDFLDSHRESGLAAVVASAIHADESSGIRTGDRLLLDAAGVRGGSLAESSIAAQVAAHAWSALREGRSRFVHLGGAQVFVEWTGPSPALVIFGAGHDAIPVVELASGLGWRITVADGRPAYARAARFPGAERVVSMTAGDPLRGIAIDRETAVVMMTHNYPLDARLLPRILPLEPRYLGMLGPRTRTDRLFAELRVEQPPSVHAPVGLDIGCDTPAAIAVSIVAEIQAAISHRPGAMLKHRNGAIHAAEPEFGEPPPGRMAEAARPAYCETRAGNHA